jgi:CheY-like chemotaxis protein
MLLATNGAGALSVANQHIKGPIDLLVTDVMLPQLGGTELAQRLRAMYPDIKVLTGMS